MARVKVSVDKTVVSRGRKMPTIRQLVEALQQLPQDVPVALLDDFSGALTVPSSLEFDDTGSIAVVVVIR